jgi:amino acid efflux transporter
LENLTFLSREFRRPESDFMPVAGTSLAVYGLMTALLTVAIAVRTPRGAVDQVIGLVQLARTMQPRELLVIAVAVIACGAATINATAWVWGVSRLLAGAGRSRIVPPALAHTGSAGVPRRAVLLLASLFAITLALLLLIPAIVVDAVATASAIFVILYLLTIVSYLRIRGLSLRSGSNILLVLLFGASLVESGWRSAYGIIVLLLSFGAQLAQRRSARTA